MTLRLRPVPGLPRRSVVLEVVLALLVGLGAVAGAFSPDPTVPPALTWLVAVAGALSSLYLRRTAPLVLFGCAALAGALTVDSGSAMLIGAYAVARYDDRWRVRAAAAVAGVVLVSRPWAGQAWPVAVSDLASALFVVLLPGAIGAWASARAQLLAALRERAQRAEEERELLAREAVRTERTRIAREMHDVVGHRVSLMVLQAGAIEVASADRQRVERLSTEVQRAGRQALEELRQLVGVLRAADEDPDPEAPLTPQPGLDDVPRLVAEARASGLPVELTGTLPDGSDVDPGIGRAAYRIVQEALTNAGKHAPGADTRVTVERDGRRLVVRVVNGPPRDAPTALPGGGFGLVGLRERVRMLDGTLQAGPRLDGGFCVEAVVSA
jgi:signal transduction histidine kinase